MYGLVKAKQKKTQSLNTEDIKENNDEEPLHRIDLIDKERELLE